MIKPIYSKVTVAKCEAPEPELRVTHQLASVPKSFDPVNGRANLGSLPYEREQRIHV